MANTLTSLKRQIEILALFYSKPVHEKYYVYDLADKYFVSEITINRDLRELRKLGISINSIQNRGVEITGAIPQKIISDLVIKYLAHINSELILSPAFEYIKQKGLHSLNIIGAITNSIEKNNYVQFEVEAPNIVERSLKVIPYKILDNSGKLEIVFVYNNVPQSIEFKYIISAKESDEHNKIDFKEKIKDYIKSTYGKKSSRIKIKLQVSSEDTVRSFAINNIQLIRYDEDGTVIAESEKSSLEDVAVWAMKQSGKVKILEPQTLINKIREMADMAIKERIVEEEKLQYGEQVAESKMLSMEIGPREKFRRKEQADLYTPGSKRKFFPVKPPVLSTIELELSSEFYF